MKRKKHAYLIMAHGSWGQLEQLLSLLDDKRNDIFLHIDIKAKDVDLSRFQRSIQCSELYFIKSRNVTWGGDSQIKVELDLIECAVRQHRYDYLHLLSGVDLPIKSKDYIFRYFEENNGKEFVMIDRENDNKTAIERVNYHYFFQNKIGRNPNGLLNKIQSTIIKVESLFRYSRNSREFLSKLHKGPNWFSITGSFAKYIVSKREWIDQHFKYTFCADEVFMQTLLFESPFKDNVYVNDNLKYTHLRLTDWQRGNPYTWQNEDLGFLLDSPYLFARKFDTVNDTYIYEQIKKL